MIKVASYNIRKGVGTDRIRSPERILAVLHEIDADVIALVRRDVQVVDCEAIHLPTLEPRGAVMADLRIRGQALRVVGMHLDLSGLMRRRQADAILAHLDASTQQLPTVMMGGG